MSEQAGFYLLNPAVNMFDSIYECFKSGNQGIYSEGGETLTQETLQMPCPQKCSKPACVGL